MITVIVPVYNAEKYLARCVDSILTQTYENLELILVDDGSNDGSGEICDAYAAQDSRVKVIHQANSGVSAARNSALAIATGTYLCFVDSDDYIHTELFAACLAKFSEDVDIVTYEAAVITDAGLRIWELDENCETQEIIERTLLESASFVCHIWTRMYRSSLWQGIRFPEGITLGEDEYILTAIFLRTRKIAILKDKQYFYDMTNQSPLTHESGWHSEYYLFLASEQKLQYCELRPQLLEPLLRLIFKKALKVYNANLCLRFLSAKEERQLIDFLHRYKHCSAKLSIENRLYLWGFQHQPWLNKMKGLYYKLKTGK